MHLSIELLLVVMAFLGRAVVSNQPPADDCLRLCGNVNIPYPFGLEERCLYNNDFLVACNRSSSGGPKLTLGNSNVIVTNINTTTSEIEVMAGVAYNCYNSSGPYERTMPEEEYYESFSISNKNKGFVIGCDTYGIIVGKKRNGKLIGGTCLSTCDSVNDITDGSCSGAGCCDVTIHNGTSSSGMALYSFNNHSDILKWNPCSYAFIVTEGKYKFSKTDLLNFGDKGMTMPRLLNWAIGNKSTCDTIDKESDDFLCKGSYTECDQDYDVPGYRCRCLKGYDGNPYIKDNCKNINECDRGIHDCVHDCIDTEGSFKCSCDKGYFGDGRKGEGGTGCTKDQPSTNLTLVIEIALCTLVAVILSFVLISWVYFRFKNHKDMMLREKFFRQNGGIMLQQRIRKEGNSHGQVEVIFTMEELKRATDNYDESKIIGKGGYGTVYKGVLSDNRIVAIKKSKLADQTRSQIDEFINEVVILSQINHRNVVKLIGCCLETEVPLLVYEFIPNGTLSDHIHNESKSVALTWDIRLRIATGTAGALSYLHCAASVPIIHRDIKPTNILLDDNYVAKVADFGASKLIPVDQIELETLVRGTLGYLDPEYLQTNQLTEKSDVYSFGVVLVELLTGRKALSFNRPEEERSVAKYFLSSLEDGRLFQVLDEHLQLKELPKEIMQVSRLAERCLRVKGIERPTMKEVTMELDGIVASMIQKHPWLQSSAKEEEGEHLLKQSAGNYTFTDGASGSSGTFDSICREISLSIPSGR